MIIGQELQRSPLQLHLSHLQTLLEDVASKESTLNQLRDQASNMSSRASDAGVEGMLRGKMP